MSLTFFKPNWKKKKILRLKNIQLQRCHVHVQGCKNTWCHSVKHTIKQDQLQVDSIRKFNSYEWQVSISCSLHLNDLDLPVPAPVVWSPTGPVPKLPVLLECLSQSKSSVVSCIHPHVPVSKSQWAIGKMKRSPSWIIFLLSLQTVTEQKWMNYFLKLCVQRLLLTWSWRCLR